VFDVDALKAVCRGRWPELLSRLCGLSPEILDGKNHPCPKCGGKDRFRLIDADDGALFCNACFSKGNGDGIAAVMWMTGDTFPAAVQRIAAEVGLSARAREVDLVEEMAWRKGVSPDALRAFGAAMAERGKLPVCRVPMYDPDMQRVGNFDMATISDEFLKGKTEHGGRLGMFVATKPAEGDRVLIVEGVKDAAALGCAEGFIAVGLPTCRMDAAFARMFRGCHVTIIPDRDKAGVEGAQETAGRLFAVAASVKIAELPAEYKETGGADVRDVLKQRDGKAKLLGAIAHAKDWLPEGKTKPRFVQFADAVVNYVHKLEHRQVLVTTGLPDVDYALAGGVMAGEMIIVAGRPSHGKTMVGLQALDWITKEMPALLISEEMPVTALCERAVERLTEIDKEHWENHRDELLDVIRPHYVRRQPLLVVESCMNVEVAIDAIEDAKREYNIGAFAVDYVQRLRGRGNTEYEWVTDSSARLKQVAMRNDLVFFALCQLNRGIEQRATSSPRMSDLRASGQLEQDADVILFVEYLHRTDPAKYGETAYRIMIAKNRNRATRRSIIECVFKPDRQTIYPVERHVEDHRNYHPEFETADEVF